MNDQRPDPDELLARVQAEETQQAHGKLKIFFGAAAGVGKTYAMLDSAHARQAEGVDVLVGYVETHGRAETEALLQGLEMLPPKLMEYRGTQLREFDLDAALTHRPTLILVDELAHTNAPGSRHAKRWQDVEELLAAGIHVYTTVNVQHLESLNDVVAQITGVVVRETFPDTILEGAEEVELIDLSPDDLLVRLKEGKVYVPQQAEQAMRHFFRMGNLMALRELALRRTADRVDSQLQAYKRDHAIAQTWPAAERILVCVSTSPLSTRLVRAARRMATGLNAEWIILYVETPRELRLPEAVRDRVTQTLRLAEQLGGQAVTLSGQSASEEILQYAHSRNVSKIVIGKPARPRWQELLFGSVVDHIVRHSGDIDVYVITGEADEARPLVRGSFERTSLWPAYLWGVLVVVLCTLIAWLMFPYFAPANLIMVYLVGVMVTAIRFGRGPSILASVLSVAAFDFFYVVPYLTFAVSDTQYVITFAVMLLVGLTISNLAARVQQQAVAARQREKHTATLYAMSRGLASTRGRTNLAQIAVRHVGEVFESRVAIFLPDENGRLGLETVGQSDFCQDANERGVVQWVYDHAQVAGLGTDTLPGARALYLPLMTLQGMVGVLGICPAQPGRFRPPEQLHLLETFAQQIALALERAQLAEVAEQARIQVETEQLRSSLLSSVSHDLRTPLASITGAASTLLDDRLLETTVRYELAQSIYEEANRLNRLVRNLLDMTRVESGAIQVKKNWQPLEEVVGAALSRVEEQLGERPVSIHLPADLPLVPLDEVLIEQVLVNLLENAVKHTPPGTPIELAAWAGDQQVTVEVADRGPGLAKGDEQRVFDKFYRAHTTNGGVGLGLTICRGIVAAHGGRIWAENRPDGGAVFRFTLPLTGQPPPLEWEGVDLQTAEIGG